MSSDIRTRMAPSRQFLRFEIIDGPRKGENLTVPMPEPGEPPVLIGRSRECAVSIDAVDISRRHTEILCSAERRPQVRDLGSRNGTLLNAQPVSQTAPMPLQPGDHIRVGLTELLFSGLVASVGHQPKPAPAAQLSPYQQIAGSIGGAGTPPPSIPPVISPTIGMGVTVPSPVRAATLPGDYFIYFVMRNGQRYLFEGEEIIVGRGQANDIVIDSNSISRQHARLQKTVAGVVVHDLGSTNKTFVNGTQADGPVLLRDGDLIRFGDIEADFKLEPQRLTNMNRLIGRLGNVTTQMLEDSSTESTQRDFLSAAMERTQLASDADATFMGTMSSNLQKEVASETYKKVLEQSETALDIRIVGRNVRQASDVVPDLNEESASAKKRLLPRTEVARLEGVYLTEGIGRATELILNNVRLGLKPGELVALVGPSGSGKTEIIQVMGGFRAADRGQITIMGRAMPTTVSMNGQRPNLETDKELARWRLRTIGYLSSELDQNIKQSVIEQVMFVLEQAGYGRDPRERLEKALERLRAVGLTDQEVLKLRPPELNRTERKQLALARALALDPPLLLADEPTGNIPSGSADRIFKLLKQMVAQGQTVFMVTSDPLWARNADRQIEILDGSIVGGLT